jgi:predicted ATPase
MLTRLRVKGFKNLRDVDLAFGPFTCIAGRNGAGKSNVFDAIALLSDLASYPLVRAATRVRGTEDRIAGIEALFSRPVGSEGRRIEFKVEMVVPGEVTDDYDRQATPRATFLEYALELRYEPIRASTGREPLYIESESLVAKPSSRAASELRFGPSKAWLKRHLHGPGARKGAFIDTRPAAQHGPSIQLHGDGRSGPPAPVPAHQAPQTVLSGVNTSSYPTVLAARREMQSWRQLQLEPTALRMPDDFRDASALSATGRHLPNTVLRCDSGNDVALRLSELIPGIRTVRVDADDKRQIHTLEVTMRDRQSYAASALSDGTLRFLALAVLACDTSSGGLVCLEEPENGIHPSRVPQMMALVRSLAEQLEEETAEDEAPAARSPIRQVLINTHSPLVVAELVDDELLLAETLRSHNGEWVNFRPVSGTWRAKDLPVTRLVSRGELAGYLDAQKLAGRRNPTTGSSMTLGAQWEQLTLDASTQL